MTELLWTGPEDAKAVLILAHGAGQPMDSPFMDAMAEGAAARGVRAARFEFPYMARRRAGGGKKPPDRMPTLLAAWREAVLAVRAAHPKTPIAVGGKSFGGRTASMIAAGAATGAATGANGGGGEAAGLCALVCLGYPFHPPGKPEKAEERTRHLADIRIPALIVQGTRDPFGGENDLAAYQFAPATEILWMPDGDHHFTPRKSSGFTQAENWSACVDAVSAFVLRAADVGVRA
ncbi:MAG: alpha/beta family hydrolase [Rhodospirillales bacterium]